MLASLQMSSSILDDKHTLLCYRYIIPKQRRSLFSKTKKKESFTTVVFFPQRLFHSTPSSYSCSFIYVKLNAQSHFAKFYSTDHEENYTHWKIPQHLSKPRQTLGLIKTCNYSSSNTSPSFFYHFHITL